MLLYIWSAAILVTLFLYYRHKYSRFRVHGVKNLRPLPPVGNSYRILLRLEHMADDTARSYWEFPTERFVGRFDFTSTLVIVRDLELIKRITVKDFEHFLDHRVFIDEQADPLFGRNLFSLKGEEWKDMRGTLSPAFTSSKIRLMVPFMVDVGDQMINVLKKNIAETKEGYLDIETKDLLTRYANDVIASCAFGLKVNSHEDLKNEFYMKGKEASTFGYRALLAFVGYMSCPDLMKKLKISLFSEDTKEFFRNLVKDTMRNREEKNLVRPDMIQLLMDAKKGKLSHDEQAADNDAGFSTVEESEIGKKTTNRDWSDDDLIAQALLFFIAGFDSVSSAMCFLLHELAVNPEVQERLVQEIRQNEEQSGGKFDYSAVQQMKYLDMVVSEVLRLWPAAPALDRLCTKDYNMGPPNDQSKKDFILRKGEGVTIPAWAIHRDPKYFPDPLRFDPERFSDENKHNIKPFTYMPFGLGPRNCIGSRFALCEVKVMAYQLVKHMELSVAAKTKLPAKLVKESFTLKIEGGHWVRFRIRESL